jgi:hypothetical protein
MLLPWARNSATTCPARAPAVEAGLRLIHAGLRLRARSRSATPISFGPENQRSHRTRPADEWPLTIRPHRRESCAPPGDEPGHPIAEVRVTGRKPPLLGAAGRRHDGERRLRRYVDRPVQRQVPHVRSPGRRISLLGRERPWSTRRRHDDGSVRAGRCNFAALMAPRRSARCYRGHGILLQRSIWD